MGTYMCWVQDKTTAYGNILKAASLQLKVYLMGSRCKLLNPYLRGLQLPGITSASEGL